MVENREWGSYRLMAGILVVVVIALVLAVMGGYRQREVERRAAAVEAELTTATHAVGELEQRGTSIAWEGTASAQEVVTAQAKDAKVKAEQATTIAEQATAQAKDAKVIVEQATTIAEQATALVESDAGRAELQARITLARQLAAESELAIREADGASLSPGALLAIESVRQYPTLEGDRVLRRALSIMPRLEFQLTKRGQVKQMTFAPDGRWMAAAHTYHKSVTVWDLARGEEIALLAHDSEASGVAFDPTGRMVATTATDGTARLWETGTWQQIARLAHDANKVDGVTFGPEGKRLATRSGETATLWDVATGREIARLEHRNDVREVAFSPYGQWIATAESEGSTVWIWDVETGEEVTRLKHDSIVGAMAFSPYGKWLATASGNTAQVWEVNTGRLVVRVMHRDLVKDIAFSPDSMLLATGSKDTTARLWEVATGRELMQFEHKNEVVSLDFSPDGVYLATGSGHIGSESPARVWDVATGQEMARMEHPKQVENVAFSPDGRWLATQHWSGNIIHVWDLWPGGPEVQRFGREDGVKAVAFSADGNILASGNADGSLQVWDTATWQEITPAPMKHDSEIRAIALSPDGSRLASTAVDGTASVWDLATGEELIRMSVAQYVPWITDVAFSPDGKHLATSSGDLAVQLWDVVTGVEVVRTMQHKKGVIRKWDVDFSPDGQRLASIGRSEVRVLAAPDWQEVVVLGHAGANDIAFSPDGSLLASVGSDDMARVWDTATWQEVVHMKHNDRDEVVSAVAFSPDGRKLATASNSTMTRVWDTETWAEIARMPIGADLVLFSPDGRWLLTQRDYGDTVRVWDTSRDGREVARIEQARDTWDMALSPDGRLLAIANGSLSGSGELLVTTWQPEDLAAEACARLGRNLTLSEWQQSMGDEPYSETCPGLPIPLSSFRETLDHIEERLCMDDADVASARYEVAVSLALQSKDEFLSSNLCKYGAQEGFAETVLPACEHAVELAPNETSILDSRGIARALVGDTEGALEDLKPVVEAWESNQWYAELVAQRKQIIEAMEKGEDVTPYIEGCREFVAVKPTPSAKTPTPTATPTPDVTPTPQPEAAAQPTEVVRSFVADVERVVAGRPGETVSHTLTVTNTGNVTSSYDIWAKTTTYHEFSLPGLGYGSDTFDYRGSVGVIGPGDSAQMPIKVSIPSYATGDEFELVSLLVQSEYTPGVSLQLVTVVSYTTSIERVGHVGLDARDVFVRDNYAYVAAGMEGLRILDVSDTLHPVEVGSYKTAEGALGQVKNVQVVGDYAYLVTNLSGIRIVDVSDPASPVEVGAYRPGGSVSALKLAGDYAYVVWNSCLSRCVDRLRIVDISDPAAPVEVSVYGRSFEAGGYETGDRINDVAVLGDHVYVFLPDEMRVLDVSNPAAPVEVDAYEKTGYRVVGGGDYAYITDEKQVRVVDISNPELVVEVDTYTIPDAIVNVSQAGGYLYVATEKDDVYILDLAIPSSPWLAGIYNAPGNREIGGVAAKGSYVYLAAGSVGLQIVDVSDPAAAEKAGVYGAPASVMGVALAEGYAYAADRYNGLRVLDLAAGPSAPVEVGFYDEPGAGALDVAVGGNYAYVILGLCEQERYDLACYGDLHVLDVSDPVAPVEVGVYEGGWHRVEVWGDHAFVVGGTTVSGDKPFHILDISNPAAPKRVASYDAADFALANGYLYLLSDTEERLTILDVATLAEVGVYEMPEHHQELYYSREIAVAGDYAYVLQNYSYCTGSGADWHVVDVSDPAAPVGVDIGFYYRSVYESWGEPAAAAYGGYTFLAAKSSGLGVLDVAGGDIPTEVDSFGAARSIMDVAADNEGYVYVASDLSGLYVLRYVGNEGSGH